MRHRRAQVSQRYRSRVADSGSASVLAAMAFVGIAAIGGVAVSMGELAAKRASASGAADLAALAAADRWWAGSHRACSAAFETAVRNGVSVVECRIEGADAYVTVMTSAPRIVSQAARIAGRKAPSIRVSARAGPGSGG